MGVTLTNSNFQGMHVSVTDVASYVKGVEGRGDRVDVTGETYSKGGILWYFGRLLTASDSAWPEAETNLQESRNIRVRIMWILKIWGGQHHGFQSPFT